MARNQTEKLAKTPSGAGRQERTVSFIRRGGWGRRFFILTTMIVQALFVVLAIAGIIGMNNGVFYNPSDSTIYYLRHAFDPWSQSETVYIFRFKDHASRVERSNIVPDSIFPFKVHDNTPGHIIGISPGGGVETFDGGDNWTSIELPSTNINRPASPGERAGEAFLVGLISIDTLNAGGLSVLYSTQDSWQTWDTNYVVGGWNTSDFDICFGQKNGQLIRVLRFEPMDELDFSNDTGRTWVPSYIDDSLPGYYTVAGTGTEIYRWTGFRALQFFCVKDSGRDISEVFDATDYYDYHHVDPGGYIWGPGNILLTITPGEIYVIEDSTYWDDYGIKLHVYHVTNYGKNVEIYYYNMPNYEPSDPEAVSIEIRPVPKDASFLIFPNPCNSDFRVRIPAIFSSGTLKIYDMMGRELYSASPNIPVAGLPYIWDSRSNLGHQLPSGDYFIRIQKGTNQLVRKISVQK